ncbi:unnamed protein product, partial [Didymodactylos carnosus]
MIEELQRHIPRIEVTKSNRISTDQRTQSKSASIKGNNEYQALADALGHQDQILTFVQDIFSAVELVQRNLKTLTATVEEGGKKVVSIETSNRQCVEKMNVLADMFLSINSRRKKNAETQ